jgi:hypothetical protein
VRRLQQGNVQEICGCTGNDDAQPGDAGTNKTPGHQAEQDTKDDIPGQVTNTRMQGQCSDRPPPFAITDQFAVDTPEDKPVAIEKCLAGKPGNQANDGNIYCDAWLPVFLVILPQLVFCFLDKLCRYHYHRTLFGQQNLVRNTERVQHQRPVRAGAA